ncbi:MAG TPA: NUDIX hydrolase [Anaerolineaceae bacterium]|nr:NUDIX hydrolase [Anaerolineaceae bacterium]
MTQLEVHFCPACGTPVERRPIFGKLRPVCPACGWAHFEDPKVAVTALVVQDGRVLLTRRANEPNPGKWTLPGGFMDAGENPERAAERECREETGLEVRVTSLITLLSGREHPRGADILLAYRAEILGGTLTAGDDASEVNFFALDALPPLAFESTRKILGL